MSEKTGIPKVVVAGRSFGRVDPTGAQILRDAGLELVYLPGKAAPHLELASLMQQEDTVAVVGAAEPITAEMIAASPDLKVIAVAGASTAQVDLAAAARRGIPVHSVPGGNADAVADLTWGLILSLARGICEADSALRQGKWVSLKGCSVSGKTISILGFGFIGQAVARRAAGFQMEILAYDIAPDLQTVHDLGARLVSLDELLERADFLTIHVPLTPVTRGLIGERELKLMKPGAYLINVSRGAVVDELALCAALERAELAGAGVDVFSQEPVPPDHPLLKAPNCVLTPHIGAHTLETIRFIGVQTAKNILEGLGLLETEDQQPA